MNLPMKMSTELVAMSMIGDGMLALLQPKRHMRLWNAGPAPWRALCTYFEERPVQTRVVGASFVALGLWLASQQERDGDEQIEAMPRGGDDLTDRMIPAAAYAPAVNAAATVPPGL